METNATPMITEGLFSVIVPVYRVEKYLETCVASIRSQTYSNLEIILVNDDSPDRSGEICDQLAAEDSRIRVIHKKNEGAGFARNAGLDVMRGEWVTFIDSDDWIEPTLVEELLKAQRRHQADYVVSGKMRIYPNGRRQVLPVCEQEEVYEGKDAVQEEVFLPLFGDDLLTSGRRKRCGIGPVAMLYSAKIIGEYGLRFLSEREYMSEDLLFNIEYSKHSRKTVRLPINYYYYRTYPVSFSNSFSPEWIVRTERLYQQSHQILEEENCTERAGCRTERAFMTQLRYTLLRANAALKGKELRACYREYINRPMVQKIAADYPKKGIPGREAIMVSMIRNRNCRLLFVYLEFQRNAIRLRNSIPVQKAK